MPCELPGCVENTADQELPNCVVVTNDEALGPTVEGVLQMDEKDVSMRLARHRRGRSMGDTATDHSASPDRAKVVFLPCRIVTRSTRVLNRVRKQLHLDFLAIMESMISLEGRFMARRMGFQELVSNCVNQIRFFWGLKMPVLLGSLAPGYSSRLSKSNHRGLLVVAETIVIFGNVFDRVAAAERDLKEADDAYDLDPCDRTLVDRSRCSVVLIRVLTQEEVFWRQKAGIKWVKDEEQNTRYFHSLVKKRRFRGTIFEIQHEGEVLTDPIAIKRSVASFFEQLLFAESVFPDEMDRDCLEDGQTYEDRCFLCAMPMMAKVREVVFCIEPESVAGLDGFGAIFYHTYGDLILEDVFCAVSESLCGIAMRRVSQLLPSLL
ncbi:UNVERIFIED_CONTAM: hypothetical protein Sindi_1312600 [Sesamum indicum]